MQLFKFPQPTTAKEEVETVSLIPKSWNDISNKANVIGFNQIIQPFSFAIWKYSSACSIYLV